MKIWKVVAVVLILLFYMIFKTCKLVTIIHYENKYFRFYEKTKLIHEDVYGDEMFMSWTDFPKCIINYYSKTKEFSIDYLENLRILDSGHNVLYQQDLFPLPKDENPFYNVNIGFYINSYPIDYIFDRNEYRNSKTKMYILEYEINGEKYTEELLRYEKKGWLTRT